MYEVLGIDGLPVDASVSLGWDYSNWTDPSGVVDSHRRVHVDLSFVLTCRVLERKERRLSPEFRLGEIALIICDRHRSRVRK